jgi:hypothetical protein
MANVNVDLHYRLESQRAHRADLQRGFMAELADPLWLLGRQWQMGEHQGENATSPALVQTTISRRPMEPAATRPGQFPGNAQSWCGDGALPRDERANAVAQKPLTPAEAIVEGETNDWWTYGRRIRLGRGVQQAVHDLDERIDQLPPDQRAEARERVRFKLLPPEYMVHTGTYDGLALFDLRAELNLPNTLFAGVPVAVRNDHWQPADIVYAAQLPVAGGAIQLQAERHAGGDVDWWSVDAVGDDVLPAPAEAYTREAQPARFNYPGAPLPRWWQIEDAQVDIGGFPPDRSHFPTMLLLDLIVSHSNDWYTFTLDAQIGDVMTIDTLAVYDVFGEVWRSQNEAGLQSPKDWSLFHVEGLDASSIVLWPTANTPLHGDVLELVTLGVDEDANLMWAVEERAEGHHLTSIDSDPPEAPRVESNPHLKMPSKVNYLYRPSTFVPHHWHPYIVDRVAGARAFVQGRMADYTAYDLNESDWLAPEPVARLLENERRKQDEPYHHIQPSAVPVTGLRLERRYVLARASNGSPVLWVQRQRLPLLSPPATGLRFDVMVEA